MASPAAFTADDISHRLEELPFLPFHARITAMLGIGTFFDAFDGLSISAALTMLVVSFHIGYGATGVLLGAAAMGQFLGAIIFGYLAERIGRKWAFVIAIALFGACSIAAALATSINAIFWARSIQGFGIGGATPVAAALFTEFVRGSRRGLFTLLYETMFVWGLVIAPIVALACLTAFGPATGWRVLFAIGGLPIIGAVIAAFKMPESPRWLAANGRIAEAEATVAAMEDEARRLGRPSFPATRPTHVESERTHYSEIFRGIYAKRTFVVWSMEFGAYFIANGILAWSPTLYMKLGGLPANRAIMLQIFTTLFALIVCYLIAFTIDNIGRIRWFTIGFGISALGAALGVIITGPLHMHTWPTLLLCGVIVQIGAATSADVIGLYLTEMYPTRMRAWGTSAGQGFNRIGGFVGPILLGWIMAETGTISLFFASLLVVAIYSAIVILSLGEETTRRTLEELSP